MVQWVRYRCQGKTGFGRLSSDDQIQPYQGNLFESPTPQDSAAIALGQVELCTPTQPSKVIALWNNYRALAKEKGLAHPQTPLYLIKPPNTYLATHQTIQHPRCYRGKVFYEGELGIVIGRLAKDIDEPEQARQHIFGYTCVNDVTAFDLLKEENHFDQWTRAKGFDTFTAMGPVVATDINFNELVIKTYVDSKEVQNYPASDMIMEPGKIVQQLSQNMSLFPGDVICCGTSVGLGAMPRGCTVSVSIDQIGSLTNRYE